MDVTVKLFAALRERVGHAGTVRQRDADLVGAGPLSQPREQLDRDVHRPPRYFDVGSSRKTGI